MSFKFASTFIEVNPSSTIPLSGLIKRAPDGEFCGISECKIRLAWLTFEDEKQLLFLLADYLFFPNQLAKLCSEFLLQTFDIPEEQIIYAGTHTHSGPALGFLPWESEQPTYIQEVFEKLKKTFVSLSKQRRNCKLKKAIVQLNEININRRKPVAHWRRGFKKVAFMLPYNEGPVNPKMKLLSFEEKGGKKTLMVTYASHPVFNRNLKLSSDYPGFLAKKIIEKGWADEVLVFQGFNGDVRPNYQGRSALKDKIRAFFYGPDFAEYESQHIEDFVDVILGAISNAKFTAVNQTTFNIQKRRKRLRSESSKTAQDLLLRKIELGDQLQFVTANAEMFVAYEKNLPDCIFPIGCTDNNIGYVPQASDLPLGGYEVSEAPLNNGMDGSIRAEDLKEVEILINDLWNVDPGRS